MFERRQVLAGMASGLEGDVSGALARWLIAQPGLASGMQHVYMDDSDDRGRVRLIRAMSLLVRQSKTRAGQENYTSSNGANASHCSDHEPWAKALLAVVEQAATDRREWRHRLEAARGLEGGGLLRATAAAGRSSLHGGASAAAWGVAMRLLGDDDDQVRDAARAAV